MCLKDVFQRERIDQLTVSASSLESGPVVSAGAALIVPGRPDRLFRQTAELALLPLATRGATVAVAATDRPLMSKRGLKTGSLRVGL